MRLRRVTKRLFIQIDRINNVLKNSNKGKVVKILQAGKETFKQYRQS